MASFNETQIGRKYFNGEWIVEVVDIQPTKVITKVLKPTYKAGKQKAYVASDWSEFEFFLEEGEREDVGRSQGQNGSTKTQQYSFEIDEAGTLTVRDSNGVEILSTNIKGPKGDIGPQGPKGDPGTDGRGIEPRITEDGERIYFVDVTGRIVSNEFPLRGRPGAEGKQGIQGPSGKDGKSWKPEISEDRKKLRFVNGEDPTDTTPWYDIQGSKGDTGGQGPQGIQGPAGPVFIPQINADGELSWSNNGEGLDNPTPVIIKGEKGDKGDAGVIFTPVIRDGVLYWTNNQGLPNPTPVRITGPKGDVGQEGRVGLSAYEIWLSQGNRGTEQDFLNSLRGEKGSPFVDEHPEFSFMDLEDFECPIQRINTTLLTSTGVASKSPEDIIEERVQEIAHLREEGQRMKEEKKTNWFKEFTWWCAGADKLLLRMCPGEHSKYMGIGTTILFTALMAVFSSFFAMRLVFGVDDTPLFSDWGNLGAFAVSLFWGAMIFFLDRFITNTMYSDGRVSISKQEFINGLPRMLIAIFIGIVIAAPLELKIFDQEVNNQIKNTRRSYLLYQRDAESFNNVSLINQYREHIRICLENEETIKKNNDEISELNKKISSNTSRAKINYVVQREDESDEDFQKRKERTMNSNKANREIAAQATSQNNSSYESRRTELIDENKRLKTDTTFYAKQISQLESDNASINTKYDNLLTENALDSFSKGAGLFAHLSALHSVAMEKYNPWFKITDSEGNIVKDEFGKEKGNFWDTILHSWWWYLFGTAIGLIMLLFILIDISPVLYKMMLADGKYDNYLHQDKLLAQDKIRLSLAHMLKKLDEGELKRVAPFVVGDVYSKMAGDTFVFKTEAEYLEELHEYNAALDKREKIIWPFKLFVPVPQKPTPPIISFAGQGNALDDELNQANKAVFDEVLEIKKNIILAAYRKWGKEMRFHRNNDPDDGSIRPEFDDVRGDGDTPSDDIRSNIPENEA